MMDMSLFTRAKERAAEVGSLGASSFGHVATSLTSSAASLASLGQLQVSNRASNAGAAAKRLVKDLVTTTKSNLIVGTLPTGLVPEQRVDYAIVLPPRHRGSDDDGDPFPLLLTLHGLKGSRDGLIKQHEHGDWDTRFAAGVCPEMVIATISGGDNYFMDFHDKSAMWETFLIEEFLPFVIRSCNCGTTRELRYLMGGSMGGHGALKLAFRHPDKFAAVAAFEPAIDAALEPSHLSRRNHQWAQCAGSGQAGDLITQIWGGVAPEYDSLHYRLHNPASLANDNSASIKEHKLKIYIDVGDQDSLNLHDGVEFLHRVLWDHAIEHEYHLIHGADHVGGSLPARMSAVYTWLGKTLVPIISPPSKDRFELDEEERKYLKWLSGGGAEQGLPKEGRAISLESDKMIALFRGSFSANMRCLLGAPSEGPAYVAGFRWRSGGGRASASGGVVGGGGAAHSGDEAGAGAAGGGGGNGGGASPGGRHLGVLVESGEGEGFEEGEEEGGFFFGSTGLGVSVAHTHESCAQPKP